MLLSRVRGRSVDFLVRLAVEGDYEQACQLFAEGDAVHSQALPQEFRSAEGPARPRAFFSGLLANENVSLEESAVTASAIAHRKGNWLHVLTIVWHLS